VDLGVRAGVVVALAVVAQSFLGPRRELGVAFLVAVAAVALSSAVRRVGLPLLRFPSLRRFTMEVDRAIPGGRDLATNSLDLGAQRDAEPDELSRALIDRAIDRSVEPVVSVGSAALDRGPRLRPLLTASLIALAVVGLLQVVAPQRMRTGWLALRHPIAFPYSPGVRIQVTPGDASVDSGEDFRIAASVLGADTEARLLYRKDGGAWKSLPMDPISKRLVLWEGVLDGRPTVIRRHVSQSEYRATLAELRRNTEYRVDVGDRSSPVYRVDVRIPPRVAEYEIRYDYPGYTALAPETQRAPAGGVAALKGTRATVTLITEGEVADASVEWNDGSITSLETSGGAPRFHFDVVGHREYRVRLSDGRGRARFESPFFSVDAMEDRPPMVRLVEPGEDVDVPQGMKLDVAVSGADDYGLSRLLMHVTKDPLEPVTTEIRRFHAGVRDTLVSFVWDLESLDLVPGESAAYFFELFDNDAISGPKSSRTPVYEVRFPSMAELYVRTEEEYSENVVDAVKEIYESEQTLRERMQDLRQEMERSREGMSWERQKEVEGLVESHEALRQQLEQAMSALQRSIDRLSENDLMDYQVLERMQAIHDLLEQVNDERLKEMMKRVEEALRSMNAAELEKALEEFDFNQEELIQNLDRAMHMLNRLLAEQKLEALVDRLQDMLEEQTAINQSLGSEERASEERANEERPEAEDASPEEAPGENDQGEGREEDGAQEASAGEESKDAARPEDGADKGEPSRGREESAGAEKESLSELAEREESLSEQAETLEKSVGELEDAARQHHPQLSKEMEKGDAGQSLSNARQSMVEAASSMRKNQGSPALRFGLKAEEALQSMMNMMMGAADAMRSEETAELSREMLALGADLVHLSTKEEAVAVPPDGVDTRSLARDQMRIYESTGRASEKLMDIARRTLFIPPGMIRNMASILDKMNEATSVFESGNGARGSRDAQDAMEGLNRTVADLLKSNESMCSSGACSNPSPSAMSRIPSLTGMQDRVNRQTLSLSRQLGQRRLSPGSAAESLRRLAARQEAIRRGVQEIAGELQGRRDVLGRLDQLGGEIEEAAKALERGQVDRKLIERQEKILSRLLAAEQSIRKQDQDERRLSRPGQDVAREAPAALPDEALGAPDRISREILQGRSDPFPARYRSMIEAYFKALAGEKALP
jgi:hypothetical protein